MTEYRKRVPPMGGTVVSEDGKWVCEGEPRDAYDEVFSSDEEGRVLVDAADLDRFNYAHEVPRRSRRVYTGDPHEPIDHGMVQAPALSLAALYASLKPPSGEPCTICRSALPGFSDSCCVWCAGTGVMP